MTAEAKSTKKVNQLFTGRRKESSARVWIKPGTGKIIVNGKDIDQYFARPTLRMIVHQPLSVTETIGKFDIMCTVKGGGLSGQAGAVRFGLSRALNSYNPEFRQPLKEHKLLTADSRRVEPKKYGKKKARKSPQFSKR